jgi:restriction system protein
MKWVAAHPKPMTEQDVNHLAFDFNSVKLKQQPDAVDLDPQPQPLDREELAKSSPDDRLEQALKEIRSAVADDVLENLLQVSPSFRSDCAGCFASSGLRRAS